MRNFWLVLSVIWLWTCSGGGGEKATGPEEPPIIIDLSLLNGQAQKGPYNNGTAINVAELNNSLIPTGRNFSTNISDNTGKFSIPNVQLVSPYVELRANGFYFNEVSNEISDAQLTLYALSNLTGKSTINVNILTHLERDRMKVLMSGDALQTFAQAKLQAQEEVFAIFGLSRANVPDSELLDISQGGPANAKLLAISAIIQGDLTVGEMSQLIANISTDIAGDGSLDNETLINTLVDNSQNLDSSEIKSNLEAHYANLGVSATIPDFETEVDQFLKPPVANDMSLSIAEDTSINITLDASDPEGESLTYTILEVNNATISLNGNIATYTPALHFNGTDTFTYYANDGTSDSNIATVTVTVTAENDDPNTTDVATSTDEDVAVAVNLTAEEYDGDNYSFSLISDPSNGSVSLSGSTAIYTPNQDFNGEDSFTFEATDDRTLRTNIATATITVNAVNDAPVANDITNQTTDENRMMQLDITLDATDVDGDALTYNITSTNNGSVTINDNIATYVPTQDWNGEDTFTYVANDGSVDSNTATVTITVNAVNDAPTVNDITLTGDEDTVLEGSFDGSDVDGDALTFSVVDQPSNGTVSIDGSTVQFDPNNNFNGTGTFTYVANDGSVDSNTATVTITVNAVDDEPAANDVAVTTDEDIPILFQLSAEEVDGDSYSFSIVSQPANGSAIIDGINSTYTPNQDWNGIDSFTFQATDNSGRVNIATATITVNPVNDAPTAVAVSKTMDEDGGTIEVETYYNDIDGDTDLTFTLVDAPSNGTATVGIPGTYTPNANFNGTDTFTYTVSDAELSSDPATVTITVNPINDAPVTNDIPQMQNEDTSEIVDLSTQTSDIDGDALTYSIITDVTNGTTSIDGSKVTYTPDSNWSGTDSYTYKANDGTVDSNISTVTLTVNAVNDAPFAPDMTIDMVEDGTGQFIISSAASDANFFRINATDIENDALTFQAISVNNATYVLVDNNNELAYYPNQDFNGQDTFQYTVSDGTEESNTGTITVNIAGVNDPPQALDITVDSIYEDTAHNFLFEEGMIGENTGGFTGIDVDNNPYSGQTLDFILVSQPSNGNLSIDGSTISIGDLLNDKSSSSGLNILYTPNNNFYGTDSFTYKSNDGELDSNNVGTATITFVPVNDAPVTTDISATTNEDTNILIDLTNNMADVDNEQAVGEVTIFVTTVPSNGSLFQWDGSTDTPGNAISIGSQAGQQLNNFAGIVKLWYVPQSDYNGTDSFNFKAQDENDGEYSSGNISTATITVNAVNDKPTVSTITTSTSRNVTKNITLLGNDVDNDALTYRILTIKNAESQATMQSTTDSVAIYVPENNFFGSDYFTYKVSDGILESDIDTVFIDVEFSNLAPVAYDVTATVNENLSSKEKSSFNNLKKDIQEQQFNNQSNSVEITLNAEDGDNDTLTYSIVTDTSNGTTSISSNKVTYTPSTDWNGVDTFTYKANDGFLDSNIAKVVVSVSPQNDAPTASNISATTNEDVAFQVLLQASDIDNDDLTYSIVSTNSASVSVDGNIATYTPTQDFNGIDTFEFRANDGVANSNTATATVTVAAVNDAPVASDVTFTVSESRNAKTVFNLVGSDVDGDDISYLITDSVTKGTLSQLSGSQINYTPNIDFVGTDSLKYKVNDGKLDSNIATAIFDIQASNDAPITTDIYHAVDEDKTTSITLSATDIDSPSLSYAISLDSSNATITLSDSVITYVPNLDYYGQDTFKFYATDDDSNQSNVSTVYVNVNPVEDSPKLDGGNESIYYTLSVPLPDTVSFKMPELDPDGDSLTLYFYDNDSNNFSFSSNQDSLFCVSCQGTQSAVIYAIDSKGNQGTNATYTVTLEGGPLGISAIEEWEAGALSSGYPSDDTSALRDPRISAFAFESSPSLNRTGLLIENRAGLVNDWTGAVRDFDRFNYWTEQSQFHIELDFSTSSLAWDYANFTVNGTVPFSAYLIDAFDGSREQLYAGYWESDGTSGWSLDDGDGDARWTGPIYGAISYEPIYLFLGKDGTPYDPSKEAEYVANSDLESAGAIGWGTSEPRTLRSSLDFGTPPEVAYPIVTALLITRYLDNGQLPTADGHNTYGSDYAGQGASSFVFKTDFKIYNSTDGSSKEQNAYKPIIIDDSLPVMRYKPNQNNINDSVDMGLIR